MSRSTESEIFSGKSINFLSGETIHSKGFALVISLTMMALTVMVALFLASLVGIQSRTHQDQMGRVQAQTNALFALQLALGQLQKHAGPDQRFTARAEVLGNGAVDGSRFWTGVWNTEIPDSSPRWLVSGNNPSLSPDASWVALTGPNSLGEASGNSSFSRREVRVQPMSLPQGGSIGWWTAEQAVKSTLRPTSMLPSESATVSPLWMTQTYSPREVERMQILSPFRQAFEVPLFGNDANGINYNRAGEARGLQRIQAVRDLELLHSSEATNLGDALQRGFHDYALTSRAVLSSPNHGLKRDLLRYPDALGEGFRQFINFEDHLEPPRPSQTGLQPYAHPRSSDLRRRFQMVPPPRVAVAEGEAIHSVGPVITEFIFLVSIYRQTTDDRNRNFGNPPYWRSMVRYQLFVELWNPYSSALVPEDLTLRITELPTIEMIADRRGGTVEVIEGAEFTSFDLMEIFSNAEDTEGNPVLEIDLPFEIPAYRHGFLSSSPGSDDDSWLPGRVHAWIGPNNWANTEQGFLSDPKIGSNNESPFSRMGKFYNRLMTQSYWAVATDIPWPRIRTSPQGSYETDIGFRNLNESALSMEVLNSDGEPLATIEDFRFAPFETSSTAFTSQQRQSRFGFWFQLEERGHEQISFNQPEEPWEVSFWLRRPDIRNPNPGFQYSTAEAAYIAGPEGYDPSAYNYQQEAPLFNEEFLFDRSTRTIGLGFMEDVPLFELPRQIPLAIAHLQHLNLQGRRPFSIGNSWGDELNELFDRFFLSGHRPGDGPLDIPEDPWPHPRLINYPAGHSGTFDPDDPSFAPEEVLLVDGSFNVNSLSVPAWRGVLRSNTVEGWEYIQKNTGTNQNGSWAGASNLTAQDTAAVFRFPMSAQEVYQLGSLPNYNDRGWTSPGFFGGDTNPHPPTQFYRRSMRSLAEETNEGGTLESLLAEAIVERSREVQEVSGPFTSLEAFLRPSSLFPDPFDGGSNLSALERAIADVSELNTLDGDAIDHHAPAFISQADLMGLLGPAANIRSDTFVIRTFAKRSFGRENEKTAFLEATVQRIPDKVIFDEGGSYADLRQTDPAGFGRRFKVIDFRWKTPEQM